MNQPLKLISSTVIEQLSKNIDENVDRYLNDGFADLATGNGWEIETSTAKWDPEVVSTLDPSGNADAEIKNSLNIFNALLGMTPALARDERVWVRLCHIECLEFARSRWLSGTDKIGNIKRHLFATGVPGCRDNNAIGRLWWNGHLAALAFPNNIEAGLRLLLTRANFRLQIVDRADTAFRQPLLNGILRLLGTDQWLRDNDAAVAHFMREVNKRSGSVVFETLSPANIDEHLSICLGFAKAHFSANAPTI